MSNYSDCVGRVIGLKNDRQTSSIRWQKILLCVAFFLCVDEIHTHGSKYPEGGRIEEGGVGGWGVGLGGCRCMGGGGREQCVTKITHLRHICTG